MPDHEAVVSHYRHGDLLAAIASALETAGKSQATVTVEDLAPVDEFDIGGRQASIDFLDQLAPAADQHWLDIGCGIGGASRFVSDRYGSRVSGSDLTGEFIDTGEALCDWVGLGDRATLRQGSALSLPFADDGFDGAYMMHVGMNIAGKATLAAEVYRVLRPGVLLGIYDVMRIGGGKLDYPVPWAASPDTCAVTTLDAYKSALSEAGFTHHAERNRRDFAIEFFSAVTPQCRSRKTETGAGPAYPDGRPRAGHD